MKVDYIDIDGIAEGHRFCESKFPDPKKDDPDLYFWPYPYDEDKDSDDLDENVKSVLMQETNKTFNNPSLSGFNSSKSDAKLYSDIANQIGTWNQTKFWNAINSRSRFSFPKPIFHEKIAQKIDEKIKSDQNNPLPESYEVKSQSYTESVGRGYFLLTIVRKTSVGLFASPLPSDFNILIAL